VRDLTIVPAARVGSLDRLQRLLRDLERAPRAGGRLGTRCPGGSVTVSTPDVLGELALP